MIKSTMINYIGSGGIQTLKKTTYLLVGVPLVFTSYMRKQKKHVCQHCQGSKCHLVGQLGKILDTPT